MGGRTSLIPNFFSNLPSSKRKPSMHPTLKNEASMLKSKVLKSPSRKWMLRKTPQKSESVTNTTTYNNTQLIKEKWEKMAEIPEKCNFLTWSIENFVRKVKSFVRKYYITWLIDLANKLHDVKKLLIPFYALKMALFH